MGEAWQYQLRIDMTDELAAVARRDADDPALAPLVAILRKHDAELKCQFDAFAGYVAEAEREGRVDEPLYKWTKATIEDPAKKAKYVRSFTIYVGGDQVYPQRQADALEADLQDLVGSALVLRLHRYDTDPAKNPQPPARYRT